MSEKTEKKDEGMQMESLQRVVPVDELPDE